MTHSKNFIRELRKSLMGSIKKIRQTLTIGTIFTRGFLASDVFPLQICAATLKHFLYGHCEDQNLFTLFMNFIPDHERSFIET